MRKYLEFINETTGKNSLKYYCFDMDDNLLHMNTIIHMDKLVDGNWKPVDVSTKEFAQVRTDKVNWRYRNDVPDMAFSEFRDWGPRKERAFLDDSIEAIENESFGPSWNAFIRCLVDGNLFMIITTRGHSPKVIRSVVEWIIYNYLDGYKQDKMIRNLMEFHQLFDVDIDYLVDQYLDNCDFIGVMSEYFKHKFGATESPEVGKAIAMKYFKNKVVKYGKKVGYGVKLGFSDDDPRFKNAIIDFMNDEKSLDFLNKEKQKKYPDIDYYVYDTSDPKNVKKQKI